MANAAAPVEKRDDMKMTSNPGRGFSRGKRVFTVALDAPERDPSTHASAD
jgi:hypothetical protein